MRVLVYDSSPGDHRIELSEPMVSQLRTAEEVTSQDGDGPDVIMIHTSEPGVEDLIARALEHTRATIILYSGGGAAEPERIRAQAGEPAQHRIRAFSAEEAARRLRAALQEPEQGFQRFTGEERQEVALEALEALWLFQLQLEKGGSGESTELTEARHDVRQVFVRITRNWGEQLPTYPSQPRVSWTPFGSAI
jgi:hypothetical protein